MNNIREVSTGVLPVGKVESIHITSAGIYLKATGDLVYGRTAFW